MQYVIHFGCFNPQPPYVRPCTLSVIVMRLLNTSFIHSFIHYKHFYSASSSGATQMRYQTQHDQIEPP